MESRSPRLFPRFSDTSREMEWALRLQGPDDQFKIAPRAFCKTQAYFPLTVCRLSILFLAAKSFQLLRFPSRLFYEVPLGSVAAPYLFFRLLHAIPQCCSESLGALPESNKSGKIGHLGTRAALKVTADSLNRLVRLALREQIYAAQPSPVSATHSS